MHERKKGAVAWVIAVVGLLYLLFSLIALDFGGVVFGLIIMVVCIAYSRHELGKARIMTAEKAKLQAQKEFEEEHKETQ